MKFLIDAQLPPKLAHWFAERGHEAEHLSTIGMLGAPDEVIAARAERDRAILVIKDQDFLFLRRPDRFGVLWLRLGNATNAALAAWLEARWPAAEALLRAGEGLVELR